MDNVRYLTDLLGKCSEAVREPTKRQHLEASLSRLLEVETLGSCAGDDALYDAKQALRRAIELCRQ